MAAAGNVVERTRDQDIASKRPAEVLDATGLVDRRADHREVQPVARADIAVEYIAQMEGKAPRGQPREVSDGDQPPSK